MIFFGKSRYVTVPLGQRLECDTCSGSGDEEDSPCPKEDCGGTMKLSEPDQECIFERPAADLQQPMLVLAESIKGGDVIHIDPEQLKEMQVGIAKYLRKVDGEEAKMSAADVNEELSPTETYGVFMSFIVKCQIGEKDRQKSRRQSQSDSLKTPSDTTVADAPTKPSGLADAPIH